MQLLVFLLFVFAPIIAGSPSVWSYENTKLWSRKNRYCGGKSQSPIDLQFNVSQYDRRLKQLSIDEQNPRSVEPLELVNNGRTAQLSLKGQYVIKNIAPQGEDYKIEQLHFHWGHSNDNINGSEHLLEGKSYPLEMHIVSYSNWYPNIADALSNTRSLAVLGLFFELSEEPNPALQPLVDALAEVRGQDQRASVSDKFNLKDLVDEERLLRYYRYDGSLTTPPCYESVVWSVAIDPLKISLVQLHAFRYLHNHEGKLIQNTYRAVKPLGTRLLFRSFLSENIYEDYKQRSSIVNRGHHSTKNLNLIMIFISLLKAIF